MNGGEIGVVFRSRRSGGIKQCANISVYARFNIARGSGPEETEGKEWDAKQASPGEPA